MGETERDRNFERERAWNSPRPRLSSDQSPSSVGNNYTPERTRKHSRPSHSDSAQPKLTPERPSLSQQSSRASSPNGSIQSFGSKADEVEEVARERNWNSPQPKWKHRRSLSPIPPASPSPRSTPATFRIRKTSLVGATPKTSTTPRESPSTIRPRKVSASSLSVLREPPSRSGSPAHLDPSSSPRRNDVSASPGPRPNSPLPPPSPKANSTGNGQASTTPPATSKFGWPFPRNRMQLPPLDFDDTTPERSTSPVYRPSSQSNPTRLSHIPVRSSPKPKSRTRTESLPAQSPDGTNPAFKKGHKRTTTELSDGNGLLPPRINVVEDSTQEMGLSQHQNRHADSVLGGFGCVQVVHELIDLAESDEDVQMVTTPVIRTIPIPLPEEPIPPKSPSPPPSQALPATMASDFARLQKAVNSTPLNQTISTTPPSSPPPVSRGGSVSALSTPPRPSSFSASRIEFQTPSPPKGLPDLPGPPSEDEAMHEDVDQTPRRQNGHGFLDFSSMKTPRPPGAWAATPAPAPAPVRTWDVETPAPIAKKPARARSNSLPQESSGEFTPSQLVPVRSKTPPSAMSKSNSLPTRTPAPPGAWLATPGTSRTKSLMKVRFEVSDSAPSDSGDAAENGPLPSVKFEFDDSDTSVAAAMPVDSDASVSEPSFNGVRESSPVPFAQANGNGHGFGHADKTAEFESQKTPVRSHSSRRKVRKSPRIRFVDAFGQEQREDVVPGTPARKEVSVSMRMPGGALQTPRNKSANKSKVRMLDAMGREVEEPPEQNDSEDTVTEGPIGRAEALARVKKAVKDLHVGLSEVDTYVNWCSAS